MNKKFFVLLSIILILIVIPVKAEETTYDNLENLEQYWANKDESTDLTEDSLDESDLSNNYNSYINESTHYQAIIDDKANLLSDGEKTKLLDSMQSLTIYGNIAFVSTKTNYSSTGVFASNYYHNHFSTESGTIFVIDMANREIYIFSDGANYRVITSSKAYSITDNVYKKATNGDYYDCADMAFHQIKTLLDGGKILEPMRYTSNVFIALVLSFMITFFYIFFKSKTRKASLHDIVKNCDIVFNLGKVTTEKMGTHRVYSPQSDSSSSGGGGGGGGSSGGGGGHSF